MGTRLDKLIDLFKALSLFGSAQLLTQGLGFVAGILIVRYLTPSEYAQFTLANTFIATMVILSDCGISASVAAQIGRAWQSREQMGVVLSTGRLLFKQFSVFGIIVTIPFFLFSLTKHSTNYFSILGVIACSMFSYWTTFRGNMLLIPPLIHQKVKFISKINTIQGFLRLALLFLVAFCFPLAVLVLLASAICQCWGNLKSSEMCKSLVDWEAAPSQSVRLEILSFVKKSFPNAVYYSISGQLSIFLISFFGSTASVAQVGALGRIGQIIILLSSIINSILISRFTRISSDSRFLFKYFIAILLLAVVAASSFTGFAWLFSSEMLWLLGGQYQDLSSLVVIAVAASAVSLVSGTVYNLGASRGWIVHPKLFIPISIASQIIFISLLDLRTVSGVLWLGLMSQIIPLIFQMVYIGSKAIKADSNVTV